MELEKQGCFFVFVGLKSFRPARNIARLWDVGQGVTMVLGETDFTRVTPDHLARVIIQ